MTGQEGNGRAPENIQSHPTAFPSAFSWVRATGGDGSLPPRSGAHLMAATARRPDIRNKQPPPNPQRKR
ncbi:unnamed protein product [Boreogadus saida]